MCLFPEWKFRWRSSSLMEALPTTRQISPLSDNESMTKMEIGSYTSQMLVRSGVLCQPLYNFKKANVYFKQPLYSRIKLTSHDAKQLLAVGSSEQVIVGLQSYGPTVEWSCMQSVPSVGRCIWARQKWFYLCLRFASLAGFTSHRLSISALFLETLFGFLITVIKVRGLPNHDQLDLSQVGDAKRGKSKRVIAHLHLNEPITTWN